MNRLNHIEKLALLQQLQRDILPLQGLKNIPGKTSFLPGLDAMEPSFPQGIFPTGAIHEFITDRPESAAASTGFISGVLGGLMQKNRAAVWICQRRSVFPPALKSFGVEPEHVIFLDPPGEKKVRWAMEEALKCKGIAAVVGELPGISFTDSRRFQLATEESGVTGIILRSPGKPPSGNACVARWRITPLPSETGNGLPGVGFPRWNVELLKIRNGKPDAWILGWTPEGFRFFSPAVKVWPAIRQRKAG